MGKTLRTGVCLLAIAAVWSDAAFARKSTGCADPTEVSALQTAAIQQELMDSALGCGQAWVEKFNAFQTSFGPELRRSDKVLLTMFKRVFGPARGDAEYNLFKTNMASKAEIKRVHGSSEFCSSANLVFAAALGPNKPSLADFVAGVAVADESPVGKCEVQVALTLVGAKAGSVVPRPNPFRVAVAEPPLPNPATLSLTGNATAPSGLGQPMTGVEQPAPPPAPVAETTAQPPKEEKKGWLSGLFGK